MKLTKMTAENFNIFGSEYLPGLLGLTVTKIEGLQAQATLEVRKALLAPNGYLHAGTVVSLADTTCGYGCIANLPEGASSFTTIELKSNFMGTAREGIVICEAKAIHTGRNTQVWDAVVHHHDTAKLIASFRCTQMIIWPKLELAR